MKKSAPRINLNGSPKGTQKFHRLITSLLGGVLLLAGGQSGRAYTRSGNTFTTDGSFADTQAAAYAASNGCIVQIPAGNFTWGHTNSRLYLTSAITLQGEGTNQTTITLPSDSQDAYGNAAITFAGPATVKDLYITATNSPATPFGDTGVNGWRITGVLCDAAGGAYLVQPNGYGLIDHCTFVGYYGECEMIFMRGPVNSWQTPDSFGTTNALVVENCTFAGSGYVCDANSNARIVVRFCTITGPIKIDGHGEASDTPPRGVRQMEIYDNVWTANNSAFATIEVRGGTAMIFGNAYTGGGTLNWFYLDEYGCLSQWPNFNNVYQTPTDYPINDQVGVGEDPKTAGSDPDYVWSNTAAGAGNSTHGLLYNNWLLSWKAIPAGAIAQYTNETGNVNSTFTMGTGVVGTTNSIIVEDRDFFSDIYITNFNGSTGMGVGTKAQMLAITATKTNVGFWVTDEGNWNNLVPTNHSGRLYAWNGNAWTLKYVPLTYPYGSTTNMYVPPQPGPPVVNPDFVTAYKNTALTYCPLTNDLDVSPGGYLTVVQITALTNGTATTDGTNITFTPANGFTGTASLIYWVSDNVGYTNSALDTVWVTNLPAGPGSPNNPALWYKLWGNTLDSSAYGNNGTSHTNMVYTNGYDGVSNHAGYFSGNGYYYGNKVPAYVQSPQYPNGVPPTNWSVSVWFKPSQITNDNQNRCVVGYASGYNVANADEMLMISNGMVCGKTYVGGAGYVSVTSTNIAPTNAWTHAVLEQDYYGNLALFVNGLQVGQVSGGPTYYPYPTYYFVGGHGDFERDFSGAIADVRLFNNYALSAQDVANLYAAGVAAFPPRPPANLRVVSSP
jgi:hypothetical protein